MKTSVVNQVYLNCKKNVTKTIEKLVAIEMEVHGIPEEKARRIVKNKILETLKNNQFTGTKK